MNHNKMPNWKADVIYSLVSAGIYTLLYILLSLLGPGPGFQNSFIARFAIAELFSLAFIVLIFGCLVLGSLYSILTFILTKLGVNEDDSSFFAFGWVASIPIVLYLAIALGFVSIGVI